MTQREGVISYRIPEADEKGANIQGSGPISKEVDIIMSLAPQVSLHTWHTQAYITYLGEQYHLKFTLEWISVGNHIHLTFKANCTLK